MKNASLLLLIAILVVVVVNLLAGLGLLGGSSGESTAGWEYKVLSPGQMDDIGFRAVAAEEGIEVSEAGEIKFPKEMVDKISKVNLLPRTLLEVEKDGGWVFVAVTGDSHYIFRRSK